MKIKANVLRPKIGIDDVDVYLPRGVKALEAAKANPRGLFRIFQRHEGASFFGVKEYLGALASLVGPKAAEDVIIYSAAEGHKLSKHETAMTLEGPARALLVNETLLHFLSTGTRFRTLAETYPGDKFPWVFMGARYLASDDLAVATRALAEREILSTVPRWADRFIGTESHSQIAMWAGLRLEDEVEEVISSATESPLVAATIRATVAFARANPEVPVYVLGDFAARSVGCAETFRAARVACERLGIHLEGGRMDVSKSDLDDQPIVNLDSIKDFKEAMAEVYRLPAEPDVCDGDYDDYYKGVRLKKEAKAKFHGMSPEIVKDVHRRLNRFGLAGFKLVVSSGIKLEEIEDYVKAGASIVGIGEEAAYFLNKGETNFTSDAVGYFDGNKLVPCAKEGRELERIVDPLVLENTQSGVKIAQGLIRHNLADYL